MVTAGFYGKLPSHGDFLRRGLPDDFVNVWDEWLQRALTRSRESLGDGWLSAYLTSPAWRFVLSRGACGDRAWAGVVIPSVDRVGRYFPFCAVKEIEAAESVHRCAVLGATWFDEAERIVLAALERVPLSPDELLAEIEHIRGLWPSPSQLSAAEMKPPSEPSASNSVQQPARSASPSLWRAGMASVADLGMAIVDAFGAWSAEQLRPVTLWWTDGSDALTPSWVQSRGMPRPDAFAAMLNGEWDRHGWHSWDQISAAPAKREMPARAPSFSAPVIRFASAGATDTGHVRASNQDAILANDAAGVWAVADGLGGHSHGEIASAMVVDALANVEGGGSIEHAVQSIRNALLSVNASLRSRAALQPETFNAGSTVVALVARGSRGAAVWAGDSRLYRLRGSVFEVLTKDHTVANELAAAGEVSSDSMQSGEITRAVGVEDVLELDSFYFDIVPGDRFLLCSDGVYSELTDAVMSGCMRAESVSAACAMLMDAVAKTPARDNASAVLVTAMA